MSPCKVLGQKIYGWGRKMFCVNVLLKIEGQQWEVIWIEGALASASSHILLHSSAKHQTMQFSSSATRKCTCTGSSPRFIQQYHTSRIHAGGYIHVVGLKYLNPFSCSLRPVSGIGSSTLGNPVQGLNGWEMNEWIFLNRLLGKHCVINILRAVKVML